MGTGAEGLPGLDHEIERLIARRLPWWTDGEPAGEHERAVKRAPALGPVVGDLRGRDVDERSARGRAQIGQRRQLAGRAVDGVLDDVVGKLGLLDPARGELEQLGEHQLGLGALDAHGETEHCSWVPATAGGGR